MWGATPGPLPRARGRSAAGSFVMPPGVTRYQHAVAGLEQELAVSVAPDDPVKLSVLTLTNTSTATRRLSVFGYVEWCLGPPRAGERRFVVTELDEATGAHSRAQRLQHRVRRTRGVLARDASRRNRSPCDRAEFVGRNRTLSRRPRCSAIGWPGAAAPGSIRAARCSSRLRSSRASRDSVAFVLGQGARPRTTRSSWRRATRRSRRREATLDGGERACGTTRSARFRSARRTTRSI